MVPRADRIRLVEPADSAASEDHSGFPAAGGRGPGGPTCVSPLR